MINAKGTIKLAIPFDVMLDISEDEFNLMSDSELVQLIDETINWDTAMTDSNIEDVDVFDVNVFDFEDI